MNPSLWSQPEYGHFGGPHSHFVFPETGSCDLRSRRLIRQDCTGFHLSGDMGESDAVMGNETRYGNDVRTLKGPSTHADSPAGISIERPSREKHFEGPTAFFRAHPGLYPCDFYHRRRLTGDPENSMISAHL